MAALTVTNKNTISGTAVTKNTLSASDTLTYVANSGQILELVNTTGGSLTLNLKGDGATTFNVPGYGAVDVSAGKNIVVASNATVALNLDNITKYLAGSGSVTLTGASGLTAVLYS